MMAALPRRARRALAYKWARALTFTCARRCERCAREEEMTIKFVAKFKAKMDRINLCAGGERRRSASASASASARGAAHK